MSQNNIYIAETYEDFAYRIQLAQDLPKGDRGYIFIGNSRVGKSTLALAMSGAQMKIVKGQGGLFYINPVDEEKYKGIVLNIQKSVTEKPNFYKPNPMNGNNFAIVDMPGHADSSRFREMINYHYICTMANNLKQVRFLLVIVMPYKNGRYHLTDHDIKMLDSFRQMFPKLNPQDNVLDIIVNRAERIGDKFADQVKKDFFENLKNIKSKQIGKFYLRLTLNNITVIEAPREARQLYPQIVTQMRRIGDKAQANFIQIQTSDYYNINLFKDDPQSNEKFKENLRGLTVDILSRIKKGIKQIEEFFIIVMKSVLSETSYEEILSESIHKFLDTYSIITKQKEQVALEPWKIDSFLPLTRIMTLIHSLYNNDFKYKNDFSKNQFQTKESLQYKETYSNNTIKKIINRLLSFVELSQGRGICYQSVKQFYLFMVRRVRQAFFLSSIIFNQVELSKKYSEQQLQTFSFDVCQNIETFNNFSSKFAVLFVKLIEKVVSINLKTLFAKYKNSQKKLYIELVSLFQISQKLNQSISQEKDSQYFKNKLKDLKQQLKMHYYITVQPSPQQYNDFFQNLLKLFDQASRVNKLTILLKLAKISQQNNDIKTAIALNTELNLNQEVMRLLVILESKESQQNIVKWFESIGQEFSRKGLFILAFKCFENIKKYLFHDLEHFLRIENKIIALNREQQRMKLSNRNKLTIQTLFNWDQIKEQIKELKHKHKIDNSVSSRLIFLRDNR